MSIWLLVFLLMLSGTLAWRGWASPAIGYTVAAVGVAVHVFMSAHGFCPALLRWMLPSLALVGPIIWGIVALGRAVIVLGQTLATRRSPPLPAWPPGKERKYSFRPRQPGFTSVGYALLVGIGTLVVGSGVVEVWPPDRYRFRHELVGWGARLQETLVGYAANSPDNRMPSVTEVQDYATFRVLAQAQGLSLPATAMEAGFQMHSYHPQDTDNDGVSDSYTLILISTPPCFLQLGDLPPPLQVTPAGTTFLMMGDQRSRSYYRSGYGCYAQHVVLPDQVFFSTEAEARAAGYQERGDACRERLQ